MFWRLAGFLSGRTSRERAAVASLLAQARESLAAGANAAAQGSVSKALALQPTSAGASHLQGILLSLRGEHEAAVDFFRASLQYDAGNADAYLGYGNVLRLTERLDDAEVAYRCAVRLKPGSEHAHKALGSLLFLMKRPAEAKAAYERALEIRPDDHQTVLALGKALFSLSDFRGVCDLFLPLLESGLLSIEDRYFLGMSLTQTGELQVGREVLAHAHAEAPDEPTVALALGLNHLLSGNWPEGFRLYEQRHASQRRNPATKVESGWLNFLDLALAATPRWSEGDCAGKHLLIWGEQGLGDCIMMLRLLPVLRCDWHAAKVTFLSPPPLQSLAACFEDFSFLTVGPEWRAARGQFDAHCSVMSLPRLMGITSQSVPGNVPYVNVPVVFRDRWRDRIGALPGLKVGLVWAGNPTLRLDALRSLPLHQLEPLLACDGVSFVSLQKDETAREELHASGLPVLDCMEQCEDFMATAALISQLDLIIAVDTAVAHLAGAMGKPVWLLNRFESEWRWLRERDDTVWYPSMRLFNQAEPRNWKGVVDRMTRELRDFVAAK